MKIKLIRWFFKILRKTPADMPMVSYWKIKDKVEAKLYKNKDGILEMQMEGEKYPFPGFPRGHILFGVLSKLKHEVKNQIFNESWALLEKGTAEKEVVTRIKQVIVESIYPLFSQQRFEMVPPEKMLKPVKELYRAWTKVAPGKNSSKLRDILCHILQEDDSYRFRVQWLVTFFKPLLFWGDPIKRFDKALALLEHAETIGDMKERARLLRRIVMVFVSDPSVKPLFCAFLKEVKWSRVRLGAAEKYFFRGKYFKVDFDKFDY